MKKFIIALTACLSLFYSCNKVEQHVLPSCIQEITPTLKSDEGIVSVKTIEKEGVEYFWLHTGAVAYDGAEYVVGINCDTLCYFCGQCISPECEVTYFDEWLTVWESE